MAIHSNSLADLIELTMTVPMQRNNWWAGTCTGGTTGTFIDTSRYEKDDYFNNLTPPAKVRIYATTDQAAPRGEERYVTSWTQSTGTGVPHTNFSVAPAAGDKYAILSEYQWSEIKMAINSAIDRIAMEYPVRHVDETVQLQSATYEYTLPLEFVAIYKLTPADGNGDFPSPLRPSDWGLVHSAIPKIHLYRQHDDDQHEGLYWHGAFADGELTDNRYLRIEGYKRHPKLDDDQDVCEMHPLYIAWQAAAYMHAARVVRSDTDPDEHRVQFTICQQQADKFLSEYHMDWAPNTRKVY